MGGYTANLAPGRGELQQQIGGNYEIRPELTLDFGVVTGQAVGSPHHGFQLGFSRNFGSRLHASKIIAPNRFCK